LLRMNKPMLHPANPVTLKYYTNVLSCSKRARKMYLYLSGGQLAGSVKER